jgi:hypothetical protein
VTAQCGGGSSGGGGGRSVRCDCGCGGGRVVVWAAGTIGTIAWACCCCPHCVCNMTTDVCVIPDINCVYIFPARRLFAKAYTRAAPRSGLRVGWVGRCGAGRWALRASGFRRARSEEVGGSASAHTLVRDDVGDTERDTVLIVKLQHSVLRSKQNRLRTRGTACPFSFSAKQQRLPLRHIAEENPAWLDRRLTLCSALRGSADSSPVDCFAASVDSFVVFVKKLETMLKRL